MEIVPPSSSVIAYVTSSFKPSICDSEIKIFSRPKILSGQFEHKASRLRGFSGVQAYAELDIAV